MSLTVGRPALRQRAFRGTADPRAPRRPWRPPYALLLAVGLTACATERDITIRGDVMGLDTLGFRADSLLAEADRTPLVLDSIRAAFDAQQRTVMAAGSTTSKIMARGQPQRSTSDIARTADRARSDSVRGILTLRGTAPSQQIVLVANGQTIALSGMATTGLSRLVGTELMVRGVQITPRDIVVSDFVVRGFNGHPAFDGVLTEGGSLRLTDGSGTKRLPSIPASLRGVSGVRVWVAYPAGQSTADGYGVITRR